MFGSRPIGYGSKPDSEIVEVIPTGLAQTTRSSLSRPSTSSTTSVLLQLQDVLVSKPSRYTARSALKASGSITTAW